MPYGNKLDIELDTNPKHSIWVSILKAGIIVAVCLSFFSLSDFSNFLADKQQFEGIDLFIDRGLFSALLITVTYLAYILVQACFSQYGFTVDHSRSEILHWKKLIYPHADRKQNYTGMNQVTIAPITGSSPGYALFLNRKKDHYINASKNPGNVEADDLDPDYLESFDKNAPIGVMLGVFYTRKAALAAARKVSLRLGFPLRQVKEALSKNSVALFEEYAATPVNISYRPQWLRKFTLLPLLLLFSTIFAYLTGLWEQPFIALLHPSYSTSRSSTDNIAGRIRIFAAETLQSAHSEQAIFELVFIVNTADPTTQTRLMQTTLSSLSKISGISFVSNNDMQSSILAVNRWAAQKLQRNLDSNGGVLTWYTPALRIQNELDEIAGPDPQSANHAWLFIGQFHDLPHREDWLREFGPAFADARKLPTPIIEHYDGSISFLIDSIDNKRKPIAENVGTAIAIKFWQKISAQERGSDDFPDDFQNWWRQYAQKHRLPPLPESGNAAPITPQESVLVKP